MVLVTRSPAFQGLIHDGNCLFDRFVSIAMTGGDGIQRICRDVQSLRMEAILVAEQARLTVSECKELLAERNTLRRWAMEIKGFPDKRLEKIQPPISSE